MTTILPNLVSRSADPSGRRPTRLRESLPLVRSVDTVHHRALPGSPRRSFGGSGNYFAPSGALGITDERRRDRSVTTGWGRAVLPLHFLWEAGRVGNRRIDRRHPDEERPDEVRTGSSRRMSSKQLGSAVKYGRKITFNILNSDPVTGYLGGMDEDYYLVIAPHGEGFRRICVNLAGCPSFEIHPEPSYEGEKAWVAMEEVIAPFRTFIIRRVLGNGGSDSDARRAS